MSAFWLFGSFYFNIVPYGQLTGEAKLKQELRKWRAKCENFVCLPQ